MDSTWKEGVIAVNLYEHQQKAVDKMHNGCILWGGVGTGKSITSLAYFVSKVCKGTYGDFGSMRTPRDIYIITTAKKRDSLDWEKEAIKFGISTHADASISNIKLTVDSWNNIEDYVNVSEAFFIFDEQRVVGSGSWSKTFIKIAKHNEWVLLSATPGDTWLDYIPVFVANGWYKNRTEFKRTHVVYNTFAKFPKVDRYVEVGRLVKYRNQILVHMPYDRHTVRHSKTVGVDHDVDLMSKVVDERWHVYENRPLRDVSELFSVMRKVVNSDASRLETLRGLMRNHPRLIVFYNFDYELEMLRSLVGESTATSVSPKNVTESLASEEDLITSGLTCGLTTSGKRKSARSAGSLETDEMRTDSSTSSDLEPKTSVEEAWMPGDCPFVEECREKCSHCQTKGSSKQSSLSQKPSSSRTDTVAASRLNGSDQILNPVLLVKGARAQDALSEASGIETSKMHLMISTKLPPKEDRSAGITDSIHQSDNSKKTEPLSGLKISEWNGHKHDPIPTTDRWVYLVQYTAGSEGWNCIDTDAMIFFSLTYSYKAFHQAHGRIDRLNTPFTDLWYYTLVSDSLIDRAVLKSLKQKKSFNESKLAL